MIQTTLEGKLSGVGETLVQTLEEVIACVPGRPDRPQLLAKALGINKDLSSRVLNGVRKHDPLAAIHTLPGPAPLRQLLEAARKKGVDRARLDAAADAIDAFDLLIRTEFESRAGLDALVSASLPDARERFETTAKQAIYRGFAGVRGITCDTMLVTFLVGPAQENQPRGDSVSINAYYGLRRSRPGAHFEFATECTPEPTGQPSAPEPALLEQFCSPLPLPLQMQDDGSTVRYELDPQTLGHRQAVDIVTAVHHQASHPSSFPAGGSPGRFYYAVVDQAAKVLVFDVLVHQDLWPGVEPKVMISDTMVRGAAPTMADLRDHDQFDVEQMLTTLGRGRGGLRCADVPRYQELLEHAVGAKGWDLDEFRGYRIQQTYPIYGSQVCMLFRANQAGPDAERSRADSIAPTRADP